MDPNNENELSRLWELVNVLSEQLAHNRAAANELQTQATNVKSQAVHTGSGFPLRRFNLHLDVEEYNSELERMTAALAADNASITHDNKQLAALVREYEVTLESVMAKFRAAALSAQEHELGIARRYESALLESDTNALMEQLQRGSGFDATLARVSRRLRAALRLSQGERPLPEDDDSDEPHVVPEDSRDAYTGELPTDSALEREAELVRLQRENAELRRLLGAAPPEEDDGGGMLAFRAPTLPRFARRMQQTSATNGLALYTPYPGVGRGLAIGRMAPQEWSDSDVWRNVQERDARAGLLS
ncbi:hypothetical protein EXIGLDRAFT_733740 [Exidia glandulosa HHB12029]|uniref:Uncharacterized protein n=1 Tax=Exidia glandulosa HHB12029 TaxID=1314781 RepID=A0A165KD85_EXIGL|nr:hypothetical protein EXIGLDRAFT_733740 [Exidia glandulosa HHB12029]